MAEEKLKTCPFSGNPCIGGECSLWVELMMAQGKMGIPKKQGMCAFVGAIIISSMPKAAPQQFNLPPMPPFGKG